MPQYADVPTFDVLSRLNLDTLDGYTVSQLKGMARMYKTNRCMPYSNMKKGALVGRIRDYVNGMKANTLNVKFVSVWGDSLEQDEGYSIPLFPEKNSAQFVLDQVKYLMQTENMNEKILAISFFSTIPLQWKNIRSFDPSNNPEDMGDNNNDIKFVKGGDSIQEDNDTYADDTTPDETLYVFIPNLPIGGERPLFLTSGGEGTIECTTFIPREDATSWGIQLSNRDMDFLHELTGIDCKGLKDMTTLADFMNNTNEVHGLTLNFRLVGEVDLSMITYCSSTFGLEDIRMNNCRTRQLKTTAMWKSRDNKWPNHDEKDARDELKAEMARAQRVEGAQSSIESANLGLFATETIGAYSYITSTQISPYFIYNNTEYAQAFADAMENVIFSIINGRNVEKDSTTYLTLNSNYFEDHWGVRKAIHSHIPAGSLFNLANSSLNGNPPANASFEFELHDQRPILKMFATQHIDAGTEIILDYADLPNYTIS